LGDFASYLPTATDLRLFKDTVCKPPKKCFSWEIVDGKFEKIPSNLDTDKHSIRSVIFCVKKSYFEDLLEDQMNEVGLNDNIGKDDDNMGNNPKVENFKKLSVTIEGRFNSICALLKPITKYVVLPPGETELGAIISYVAKCKGWIVIDCEPVNHPSILSFDGRFRADNFMARCRHYLKFHHANSETNITQVSPGTCFDLDNC